MKIDASHPQRGAALLVVLVFAALVSNLAMVAMRTTLSGAVAATVFLDEMRADELGRDATRLLAQQLQSDDPQARRGGSFTARLPFSEIAVDYVSEAARIDVNTAPPKLLAALFTAAGAGRDVAQGLTVRIERLRGAGTARPAATDSSPPAAVKALTRTGLVRTEQIIDAWGLPPALYRAVQPALTVSNKTAKVDPVLASALVVTALMDGDEDRTQGFLERRAIGFFSADDALAQLPSSTRQYAGFAPTRAVRAVAEVIVAKRFRRSYEFVMTVPEAAATEPRVLSWQPLLR
uniref:General secretion pathway protein GspK n=1 Tax=Rhodopseudomonas palustris (strain BisA53) TaxID=316055 RepID=Q07N80_RHOP5